MSRKSAQSTLADGERLLAASWLAEQERKANAYHTLVDQQVRTGRLTRAKATRLKSAISRELDLQTLRLAGAKATVTLGQQLLADGCDILDTARDVLAEAKARRSKANKALADAAMRRLSAAERPRYLAAVARRAAEQR